MVKYVSTYSKGKLKKKQKKKTRKNKGLIKRSNGCLYDAFFFMCDFLIFSIKAYVVGTYLNCMDKSMQFKWIPTTYAFIKK